MGRIRCPFVLSTQVVFSCYLNSLFLFILFYFIVMIIYILLIYQFLLYLKFKFLSFDNNNKNEMYDKFFPKIVESINTEKTIGFFFFFFFFFLK